MAVEKKSAADDQRARLGMALLLATLCPQPALAEVGDGHGNAGAVAELPQACPTGFGEMIGERTLTLPLVGQVHEAEIGAPLLSTQTIGIVEDGVRLLQEARVTGQRMGATYEVVVPAGDYHASDIRGGFPAKAASFRYEREKSERGGLGKPDIALLMDGQGTKFLKVNVDFGLASQQIAIDGARFEPLLCLRPEPKALRRELLYSGGAKNAISVQYREFVNDMARPAFSQELNFDLAMGKEIGFRGARIQVNGISNTGITYVVLKPLE